MCFSQPVLERLDDMLMKDRNQTATLHGIIPPRFVFMEMGRWRINPLQPWMQFWVLQDPEPEVDCLFQTFSRFCPSKDVHEWRPPLSASTPPPRQTIAGMLQKVDTRKDN